MFIVGLVKKGTNAYDPQNHTTVPTLCAGIFMKEVVSKRLQKQKNADESVAVFSCFLIENIENAPRKVPAAPKA